MRRTERTLPVALAAALIIGQLAAPLPSAGAERAPAPPDQQLTAEPRDAAAPDAEAKAPADHSDRADRTALEDFDARRDAESGELNGGQALKAGPEVASEAVAALKAGAPGSPERVRVELHPSGLAKAVVSDDGPLTGPSDLEPDQAVRAFLARNEAAFGLSAGDVRDLEVTMNNLDEASGYTFLKYEQTVGGVPVFDSEMTFAVSPKGEVLVATAGQLVRGADAPTFASLDQQAAVAKAFEHCGAAAGHGALAPRAEKRGRDMDAYANPLGESRDDVLAGRVLVNVRGESRAAYRVLVDKGSSEYYDTLVDATTGELLYRHNLVTHAHGAVFPEHPVAGPRVDKSFAVDGFAHPGAPAGDPWLTGTVTTGNNVDAYVDRDADNLPDRDHRGGLRSGRAQALDGNFTYAFADGQDPRQFGAAAVTNAFYHVNFMHDWMYHLGFTETARNFQTNNYSRGGLGNDAVRAEVQDGAKTDNAFFSTPADGLPPRMTLHLFLMASSNLADDRDSAMDGDILAHEYGHGVSNRLIGNGSGMTGKQSKAMGEGWSDYWAVTRYDDPVMGEYSTSNSLRGFRRTPYDGRRTSPNGQYVYVGNTNFEPHDDGEIWCQTLVELRQRLGAPYTDRLVLTGMKMTATNPSMINARDGILAADRALGNGFAQCVIWEVFARHGMGLSASGNDDTAHNPAADMPDACEGRIGIDPGLTVNAAVSKGREIALSGQAGWTTIPVASSAGNGGFTVTNAPVGEFGGWAAIYATKLSGDFDADGRTDIALAGVSGFTTIPVAFSTGGGNFRITNAEAGDFAWWSSRPGVAMLTGDFNRDGRTDIALTGGRGWASIPVAFSNGDGSFTVTNFGGLGDFPGWAASNASKIVGDFNGDQRADIALCGAAGWWTLPVAFSNGDGSFTVSNQPIANFAGWATVPGSEEIAGDFNNDGRTDIALSGGYGWTTMPVAYSNGNGTFTVYNPYIGEYANWTRSSAQKVVGDFNGDKRADIALVGGAGWTSIPVAFSNGNGTFGVTNFFVGEYGGWAVNARKTVGDFNGDGRTDIALTPITGTWSSIPVAFSNGNGTFGITNAPVPNFPQWAASVWVTAVGGRFR